MTEQMPQSLPILAVDCVFDDVLLIGWFWCGSDGIIGHCRHEGTWSTQQRHWSAQEVCWHTCWV